MCSGRPLGTFDLRSLTCAVFESTSLNEPDPAPPLKTGPADYRRVRHCYDSTRLRTAEESVGHYE
ncbi:hypothetical protein BLSMQ_2745 [Brevibacterium aurantiacum]|uniref:Uncharacterized protein n=1 Tax=Brevibacterium aurantiacum TaxID=273384 RepID=A0A1D7W626_BREAU|nr:hypothetical protein BLSMQ_2745 [Brevibacterium aurantiacum]